MPYTKYENVQYCANIQPVSYTNSSSDYPSLSEYTFQTYYLSTHPMQDAKNYPNPSFLPVSSKYPFTSPANSTISPSRSASNEDSSSHGYNSGISSSEEDFVDVCSLDNNDTSNLCFQEPDIALDLRCDSSKHRHEDQSKLNSSNIYSSTTKVFTPQLYTSKYEYPSGLKVPHKPAIWSPITPKVTPKIQTRVFPGALPTYIPSAYLHDKTFQPISSIPHTSECIKWPISLGSQPI